jgi:hypothetical protein
VPERTRRRFLAAGAAALPVICGGGSFTEDGELPVVGSAERTALGPTAATATFVPRAEWGARAPRVRHPNITPGNGGVTVHYVGGVPVARAEHADCARQVRAIQNHHMDTNGWADIAYSHLVCVHGYVFEGRGPGQRTAANGTPEGNQNWYAVCGLVGGSAGTYDPVTPELVAAFHWAIAQLRVAGGAGDGINRHMDHKPTDCPGQLSDYVLDGTLDPGDTLVGGGDGARPWPGAYLSYPPVTEDQSILTWQRQMAMRGWTLESP